MRLAPDVIFRALGDGAVLVDLDGNRIFELNATGAQVWSRLADGQDLPAIVDALVAEFEVASDVAAHEVSTLVAELQQHQLLHS